MKPPSGRKAVAIYLNPGEIVIAEGPATVTTVLGSCVAVTLFSPRTRQGSICHAVLPRGSEREPGKYVDQAVRYMVHIFHEKKITLEELVAKVFGGADMFPQMRGIRDQGTIGAQNIQSALSTLEQVGINPAVVEVSGQQGRKLVFFSDTGDVYIKRVQKEQMQVAEQRLMASEKDRKIQMLSRLSRVNSGTKGDA
ncbi:MAG: chemotaxis protein CheD [Desulfobulbus sp.]|nr:chemotaxis protein CheD [Desulfobulbus sp.]